MNNLEKYFKENSIKYVLFDMDRTLVDTGPYFHERMYKTVLEVVKDLYRNETFKKQKERTEDILDISTNYYRKTYTPILVDQLTLLAIEMYLSKDNLNYNKKDIESVLKRNYKNFYNSSPSLFPYTVKTLNQIAELNVNIGVYSHAQYQWTKKKIDRIIQEYKQTYNSDLNLSFYTTDINDSKDSIGWEKAAQHLKFPIENTLVVGDSLTSDIYPAIDAGFKYLVYLFHSNEVPKIETDAHVFLTKNVGTISDIDF